MRNEKVNNHTKITVRIKEAWPDEIFQECALIQSEPTTVALQLETIKVLSVIGQRTKEHFWINFMCPRFSDSHCNKYLIIEMIQIEHYFYLSFLCMVHHIHEWSDVAFFIPSNIKRNWNKRLFLSCSNMNCTKYWG